MYFLEQQIHISLETQSLEIINKVHQKNKSSSQWIDLSTLYVNDSAWVSQTGGGTCGCGRHEWSLFDQRNSRRRSRCTIEAHSFWPGSLLGSHVWTCTSPWATVWAHLTTEINLGEEAHLRLNASPGTTEIVRDPSPDSPHTCPVSLHPLQLSLHLQNLSTPHVIQSEPHRVPHTSHYFAVPASPPG